MDTIINYRVRLGDVLRVSVMLLIALMIAHQGVLAQGTTPPATQPGGATTPPAGTPTVTPPASTPPVPTSVQNADSLVAALKALRVKADSATRSTIDSTIRTLCPAPDSLRFKDLRAAADLTRGVIGGYLLTIQLNREPIGIPTVVLTNLDTAAHMDTIRLVPEGVVDSTLVVRVPSARGTYRVNVYSDRDPKNSFVNYPHQLHIESLWLIIVLALLPVGIIAILLMLILRKYRDPVDGQNHGPLGLGLLLLEPQNHTYSLSRAQFVFWMAVLAFSYVFLFVARALVEGIWEFPPLTGFAWTFIISLGTLLTAQATTGAKGAKGAGQLHPALNDLFVHGGVVALERVQQVLWTVIAAGIFVFILIKNYAISTNMPTIPDQLLYLMGISSAGYLVGKAIRKPGPIVDQVNLSPDGTNLSIVGTNLSNDAFVWVDGAQIPGNAMPAARDSDAAPGFAAELQIALPPGIQSPADWYGAPHSVVVVNADGQRAEWDSKLSILKVEFPTGANNDTLTVTTQYVCQNATWIVDKQKQVLTQVPGQPNVWTLQYPAGSIPTSVSTVSVTCSGQTATFPSQAPQQPAS